MPSLATPAIVPGVLSSERQPILDGPAVVVRPWRRADVDALVEAYSDPAIQLWHARSMTADEAAVWVDGQAGNWSAERRVDWAVTDLGGVVVGRIGLRAMSLDDGVAAVGYWVMPAARGRGIAGSALATVAGWAFERGFERIEIEHSTRNDASCRVATKAGFRAEGVRRSAAKHADGWHDMHLHARVRADA
jgi:RimJ/RimL family protein N-acetyltransferase